MIQLEKAALFWQETHQEQYKEHPSQLKREGCLSKDIPFLHTANSSNKTKTHPKLTQ